MPQKKNLEEQDEILAEEQSHKKVKTEEGNGKQEGNGTAEKNGKSDVDDKEEIIDGVTSEAVDEAVEVKNGKSTSDEKLGYLLIAGKVFNLKMIGC